MKKPGMAKALVCALCAATLAVSAAHAQDKPHLPKTTTPPPLQFHCMGPPAGGPAAAVAAVLRDNAPAYFAAVSDWLRRSSDGGHTLVPILGDVDPAAIGARTVAACDSGSVRVASGGRWFSRPSDIWDGGVYKPPA